MIIIKAKTGVKRKMAEVKRYEETIFKVKAESSIGMIVTEEEKAREVDWKTWSETEKYKYEKISEAFNNVVKALKDYYLKGKTILSLSAFILIAVIFCTVALLTWFGRISGETFAFVSGTIVGYIITLLKG
jgi:hypothetical protein